MRAAPLLDMAGRAAVVDLARAVGAAEAARRTGHNASTVRTWVKRSAAEETLSAAIEAVGHHVPAAAVEASTEALAAVAVSAGEAHAETGADPSTPWAVRERRLALRLGALAEDALDALDDAVAARKSRDARDLAVAVGVLLDKTRLLEGKATRRTEVESRSLAVVATMNAETEQAAAAEVARLRRELGLATPPALGPIEGTATDD